MSKFIKDVIYIAISFLFVVICNISMIAIMVEYKNVDIGVTSIVVSGAFFGIVSMIFAMIPFNVWLKYRG